jgi:hypothetical protein
MALENKPGITDSLELARVEERISKALTQAIIMRAITFIRRKISKRGSGSV